MPYKFTPVDHNPWEGQGEGPDWAGMVDAYKEKLATDKSYQAADQRRPVQPTEGYWTGVARRAGEVGRERLARAADALSAPGDVLFGQRSMTPAEVQEAGSRLSGYVALGGLGRAALAGEVPEASTLGIIAGQSSKTADLTALAQRDRFADPRNIGAWRSTGWWRGAENSPGLPRHEIPDYASALQKPAWDYLARTPGEEVPLGELMSHPELYKAYPKLESMPVQHEEGLQFGGYYDPDKQLISLADTTLANPDMRRVLLHETQHGIQDIEGFPMGADPAKFWDTDLIKGLHEAKLKAFDSYAKLTGPEAKWMTPEEANVHNEYIKKYNVLNQKYEDLHKFGPTAYKYSGGENEATAVENRMNLRPNELGVSPPWESGKVPYGKQLLVPSWTAPGYERGPGGWGPARPVPFDQLGGGKGPGAAVDVAKSTAQAIETPSAATQPEPEAVTRLIEDAKAKAWTVDRTHDVPYGAGSSAEGGKTYIDRRIPSKMTVGGKSFDPAEFLKVHEQVEHELMTKGGMGYELAHHHATKDERAAVEAKGISWVKYEKAIEKYLDVTEEERGDRKMPKDLYTKPYSHTDLRKFKGRPRP